MGILSRMNGRNKQNVSAPLSWFEMGAADADAGMYCMPEFYTLNRINSIEYALGYESRNPGTLMASYFIKREAVAA